MLDVNVLSSPPHIFPWDPPSPRADGAGNSKCTDKLSALRGLHAYILGTFFFFSFLADKKAWLSILGAQGKQCRSLSHTKAPADPFF